MYNTIELVHEALFKTGQELKTLETAKEAKFIDLCKMQSDIEHLRSRGQRLESELKELIDSQRNKGMNGAVAEKPTQLKNQDTCSQSLDSAALQQARKNC